MKSLEHLSKEHDIACKLKLGIPLTDKEESFYFLYMLTVQERYQYIKNKKEVEHETATANNKGWNI